MDVLILDWTLLELGLDRSIHNTALAIIDTDGFRPSPFFRTENEYRALRNKLAGRDEREIEYRRFGELVPSGD